MTESEARRARLGDVACRRAQEVADQAPELTPEVRDALAVLLRTTKVADQAA